MGSVIIESLILAAGGILSVGSITIVILLLISDRGWHNGLAYMSGYLSSYTVIGVTFVWLGSGVRESGSGEASPFPSILFCAVGLLLLWLSGRNWRNPAADSRESPRLFAILDKITPPKALGFGALVAVVNFKNLAIFLSAVSVPLLSDLPLPSKIAVVVLIVLVFCTSVIVPVLIYVAFPSEAERRLNWIKETIERHRRQIGIWLPFVFGLIFLARGISGVT